MAAPFGPELRRRLRHHRRRSRHREPAVRHLPAVLHRPRVRPGVRRRGHRRHRDDHHRDVRAEDRVHAVPGGDPISAVASATTPGTQQAQPIQHRKKPRSAIVLSGTAWIVGILFILPVLWMVLTSFHSEPDAAKNPPAVFAPLSLEGYKTFFDSGPWPPLLNSLTASVLSTVLVLLLAFPAAYALSIKPVKKWTDVLFFFLSTKMLPIVAGILPLYLFAQKVGLLDNIWWLILLYTSMNLPIAVWMLRSFLAEVPVEMLEAASVDGASLPRTLKDIVAPVVMPGIASAALIC